MNKEHLNMLGKMNGPSWWISSTSMCSIQELNQHLPTCQEY